jgi:hypothetical protein
MNDLDRAARSKELLESLMFKEAHAAVRNELIAAIEIVPTTDYERVQEIVLSLQLHNRLKKKLERWVEDGKVEQKKLDQENWRAKAIEKARKVWG